MKKKNLIVLLASLGLLLSACGGGNSGGGDNPPGGDPQNPPVDPPVGETITHQDPFVSNVSNPSVTRAYNEDFDVMVEDFSSANPSGTTTGSYNKSFLRVLVDSNDVNEPKSADAAIYKMATGNYQIHTYDGIGFRMRMLGSGSLKLSNLVLALRGDDAFNVYPLNLAEALDVDGEALPALTSEFQDYIISPNQSIEDANTLYELAAGGNSDVKVLERILGFHLFALAEECSAVLEIEEVFLIQAGEKQSLDTFDRENVGKADPTCWWRGSTGFIVQRGVALKNARYETRQVEVDKENLVINVLGDTSGLKVNNVAYASLKDSEGNALTGAVNGAFMSYVINLENSGVSAANGKFVFESTTEVVISRIFLSDLLNELPASDYPHIDIPNASYVSKFDLTLAKGSIKTNYDDAILDTRVTDAGLNYMISYNQTAQIEVDGNDLIFFGGDYDYANLVIGSNADANMQYLVFAIKGEANIAGLRIKTGANQEVWASNWLADAGLPSWTNELNYPYITNDGYKLVIIDLARSGFADWNNEITIWYTGSQDLVIGSIFFADKYQAQARIEETYMFGASVDAGEGYAYVNGYDLPAGTKYVRVSTTAQVENEIRFEGHDGAKWLKNGEIIDKDGNVVADGSTDYIIDLVASGLTDGSAHAFHVHSTKSAEAFVISLSIYEEIPVVNATETLMFEGTVEAGEGYAYVNGYDLPANTQYVHVVTTAKVENEIRFEGFDGAKWLKNGEIIDKDGNVVADGASDYVIDLVASGLTDGSAHAFHVHSSKSAEAFSIIVSLYSEEPVKHVVEGAVMMDVTMDAGEGYAYVGGYDLPAGTKYIKVETTAQVANEIRFEGFDGAKWLKNSEIIDKDGNVVADGSSTYVIDLAASGLTDGSAHAFHVHSSKSAEAFSIKLTIVTILVEGSYAHLLSAYVG